MKKIKIICVDMQKDFSAEGGKCYLPRPSVQYIKEVIVPFLKLHAVQIAEIISDYRLPRPGDRHDLCRPGTFGYESEIPEGIKVKPVWVKCMNNPIWTRDNIGVANKEPGLPYEDPVAFGKWLERIVGGPEEVEVAIMGLTIDCCCLCTTQELSMRGYEVYVIKEGVDSYHPQDKEAVLASPILKNWGTVVSWDKIKSRFATI